jgi:DNA primase
MSDEQAAWIINNCHTFIDMYDNDKGGIQARKTAKDKLRGSHILYKTVTYPFGVKDPQECLPEEIEYMINHAVGERSSHKIKRYSG